MEEGEGHEDRRGKSKTRKKRGLRKRKPPSTAESNTGGTGEEEKGTGEGVELPKLATGTEPSKGQEVTSPLVTQAAPALEQEGTEDGVPSTVAKPEESTFITAPGQSTPLELAKDDDHDAKRRAALRKKKKPKSSEKKPMAQTSEGSLDVNEDAPLLSPSENQGNDAQAVPMNPLRMHGRRDRALHMRRRPKHKEKQSDGELEEKSDSDREVKSDDEQEKEGNGEEKSRPRRKCCPSWGDVRNCGANLNERLEQLCTLPRCCIRFLQRPLPLMGLGDMPLTAEEEGHVKANVNLQRCARDDDVLSLVIAAADALTEDPRVVHPLVRVHFVDLTTGKYLTRAKQQMEIPWDNKTPPQRMKKHLSGSSTDTEGEQEEDEEHRDDEEEEEAKRRKDPRYVTILGGPATTQYENATAFPLRGHKGQSRKVDEEIPYLLPIQTRPFALRGSNTAPQWEEEIITNESFRTFLRPETLILFELVDFGPTVPPKKSRQGEGYYKIAWAFLRPVGVRGKINLGLRGRRHPEFPTLIKSISPPKALNGRINGRMSPRGSFELAVPPRQLDSQHMKTLKLQLYKYRNLSMLSRLQAMHRGLWTSSGPLASETPQVFIQYLLQVRRKYPSTLTIHAGPIQAPVPKDVYRRPLLPTEREMHKLTFTDLAFKIFQQENEDDQVGTEEVQTSFMRRRRNEKEVCLLPDQLFHRVSVGRNGATAVSYSPKGTLLAIGCCEDSVVFPLRIYDPETGFCRHVFPGHHSMIYDIAWTSDEKYLLSTSADGTAKLWHFNPMMGLGGAEGDADSQFTPKTAKSVADLQSVFSALSPNLRKNRAESIYSIVQSMGGKEKLFSPDGTPFQSARKSEKENLPPHLVVTLQHSPPSFVYCGIFQCIAMGDPEPENPQHIVFTGSFDRNIHLWDTRGGGVHKGVLGTIVKHKSHVNAMVWDKKTGRLYTADGSGVILVWRKTGIGIEPRHFNVVRVVQHPDLVAKPVTGLALHPTRRRGQLLVQAHQNCLRLFDLTTFQLVNPGFGGGNVTNSIIRCRFSPDGRYAISGSEDGKVRVWEAQSGQIVRCALAQFGFAKPLLDIGWHPSQHVVALASYGPDHLALVYCHQRNLRVPAKMIEEVVLDEMSKADIEAQDRSQRKRMENRQKLREKKEKRLRSKLEDAQRSPI